MKHPKSVNKKTRDDSRSIVGSVKADKKNVLLMSLTGLVAVLVIVVVLGGLLYNHRRQSDKVKKAQEIVYGKQAISQAAKELAANKLTQATSTLETYLSQPRPAAQKYEALAELGTIYMVNRHSDKALTTLQAAEAIRKDQTSSNVLLAMAVVYQSKGNKAQAVVYYKKAIARIKAVKGGADGLLIPQYEATIKILESGQ
jgi:Tfp pilus assembly protein PilF